jgi:capsular exopolysaccharide synthesis family protein
VSNKGIIINKSYDPHILRTVLKRYWWWAALFVLAFATLAFIYLRYTKPTYESSMVLQLGDEDNAKDVLDIENINSRDNDLSSVVELLRSELLFERALNKLNLNVSLYSRGEILTEEKYLSSAFNIQPYELSDSSIINQEIGVSSKGNSKIELTYVKNGRRKKLRGKLNERLKNRDFDVVVKAADPGDFHQVSQDNELFFIFNGREQLSNRLIQDLSVASIDPNAKTISISFRGHNAVLCRDVVNAVSKSFIEYDDEQKRMSSENIISFIDAQLDSLSLEVRTAKDSLIRYQRKSQLPDPENAGLSISGNVNKLQDQLFELEEGYNGLLNVKRKLRNSPNRLEIYKLLPELLGRSYERSLAMHLKELHDFLERKEDLLFEVTETNSEITIINQKIASKIQIIQRSIAAIEDRLSANISAIRSKIGSLEGEAFQLPAKKMEFNRLKNIQNLNEKYFTLLTDKKVLYEISDAGYASTNRVLTKAKINLVPFAPSRNFVFTAFIMFGFFIGLGLILFRYLTFNEINMIEDLERILPPKASILGGVPLFKQVLEYSQLVVADAPKSMMAESMRKIRTNLNYIHPEYKTIAISSSISGEGKTFVALNLGGIIAMSGKKTVLLDLDLRKPKVHLGLDVDNGVGMSSLIVNQATIDQCIHHSKVENLDFITAGPIPPNPSELLLSKRFLEIVEELKNRYDVVIIDNPPVGLVSDGIKNLTDADIPIYVFKSHYSKRIFADRLRELFTMQQLKSLNVILNGIKPTKSGGYGYGYGYGHGYGYGYYDSGYTEEVEVKSRKWYQRLFKRK